MLEEMMQTNNRKFSDAQEKRVAKQVGGKKVTGSGATDFLKGDVLADFFIECKTKVEPCKSISLKKEWFDKAKEQAFQMRRLDYALAFDFGDGKDFFAVDAHTFVCLIEAYRQIQKLQEFCDDGNYDWEDIGRFVAKEVL